MVDLNRLTLQTPTGEDLVVLEVPHEHRSSAVNFPLFIEFEGRKFQKYFAYYYLKPNLRESDLSAMWDYLARDYDSHVNAPLNTAIYRTFKRVIDRAEIPVDSVLDYGVGTGRFLVNVFGPTIELFGADVSQEMCSLAEQKGINTSIILDSKTEFKPDFASAIISCYVTHLFGKDIKPFREWFRLLQPGGMIVFNHRNPEVVAKEFFQHDDFKVLYREILSSIGFQSINIWPETIDLRSEQKTLWFTSAIKPVS